MLPTYKSGYFDNLRRITLRELAGILNLQPFNCKGAFKKGTEKILGELVGCPLRVPFGCFIFC
ncbi:helix-turn-helix domain-containing protein [Pyrococcus kukulkanii]|uniref:helix-turn-helix domain-containing protein n=1 Tax=Pyrococcus kukulkanii TaxID=1609559 RepID=UPI003566FF56